MQKLDRKAEHGKNEGREEAQYLEASLTVGKRWVWKGESLGMRGHVCHLMEPTLRPVGKGESVTDFRQGHSPRWLVQKDHSGISVKITGGEEGRCDRETSSEDAAEVQMSDGVLRSCRGMVVERGGLPYLGSRIKDDDWIWEWGLKQHDGDYW